MMVTNARRGDGISAFVSKPPLTAVCLLSLGLCWPGAFSAARGAEKPSGNGAAFEMWQGKKRVGQRPGQSAIQPGIPGADSLKAHARELLEKAQKRAKKGHVAQALLLARRAESFPVQWKSGETSPTALILKWESQQDLQRGNWDGKSLSFSEDRRQRPPQKAATGTDTGPSSATSGQSNGSISSDGEAPTNRQSQNTRPDSRKTYKTVAQDILDKARKHAEQGNLQKAIHLAERAASIEVKWSSEEETPGELMRRWRREQNSPQAASTRQSQADSRQSEAQPSQLWNTQPIDWRESYSSDNQARQTANNHKDNARQTHERSGEAKTANETKTVEHVTGTEEAESERAKDAEIAPPPPLVQQAGGSRRRDETAKHKATGAKQNAASSRDDFALEPASASGSSSASHSQDASQIGPQRQNASSGRQSQNEPPRNSQNNPLRPPRSRSQSPSEEYRIEGRRGTGGMTAGDINIQIFNQTEPSGKSHDSRVHVFQSEPGGRTASGHAAGSPSPAQGSAQRGGTAAQGSPPESAPGLLGLLDRLTASAFFRLMVLAAVLGYVAYRYRQRLLELWEHMRQGQWASAGASGVTGAAESTGEDEESDEPKMVRSAAANPEDEILKHLIEDNVQLRDQIAQNYAPA